MKRLACLLTIALFAINAYPAVVLRTSLETLPGAESSLSAATIFGNALQLPMPQQAMPSETENQTLRAEKTQSKTDSLSCVTIDTIGQSGLLKMPSDITLNQSDINFRKKPNFFRTPVSRFIIPTVFITYGIVTQNNPLLQKFDNNIKNEAWRIFPHRSYVDDWIQYAPVVGYFTLKLSGVKSEHSLLNMTMVAATSYIFTTAIVRTVKSTVHKMRPDGSADNSFPSGHTATAFAGAHLLYKEYRDVSPWIGIAGYTVATATGVMRIMNRRHWFSDVVAGAGVGILSVELAYLLMPLFERWTGSGKHSDNVAISPVIDADYTGVGVAYTF